MSGPSISRSQRTQRWSQASSCRASTSSKSPPASISSTRRLAGFADAAVPGGEERHDLLEVISCPAPARAQVDRGESALDDGHDVGLVPNPSTSTRCRAARPIRILDWLGLHVQSEDVPATRPRPSPGARRRDRGSGPRRRWSPVRPDPSGRSVDRTSSRRRKCIQCGQAGVGHGDEPTLRDPRPPSLPSSMRKRRVSTPRRRSSSCT